MATLGRVAGWGLDVSLGRIASTIAMAAPVAMSAAPSAIHFFEPREDGVTWLAAPDSVPIADVPATGVMRGDEGPWPKVVTGYGVRRSWLEALPDSKDSLEARPPVCGLDARRSGLGV